ncbi:hypothetical protein JIP1600_2860002 [Flavobacterium psychrophilum]|nr:hypothetical protein JIP1600_2860002 [Flavobacterium psychrophilum]
MLSILNFIFATNCTDYLVFSFGTNEGGVARIEFKILASPDCSGNPIIVVRFFYLTAIID